MNLQELGALLKQERERRKLSIRDIMDTTKISRRNLTALEEGNVKALPHPVYLKGYIKNYALLVGLDPEALSCVVDEQCDEDFEKYLPQIATPGLIVPPLVETESKTSAETPAEAPAEAPAEPVAGTTSEPAPSLSQPTDPFATLAQVEPRPQRTEDRFVTPAQNSGGGIKSFIIVILLLCALAVLLVQYQRMQSKAQDDAVVPPPVEQPVVAAENATNATEALNATETPEVAPVAPVAPAVVVPEPAPVKPEKVKAEVMPAPAPAAAPVADVRTPGMQELVISAKPNEVCWVQVNDGQKTKSFTLKNSETRRIEFATTAKVRLGNAGGVTFRLNGVNHPYEGQRGMTDTVEFGGR